MLVNLAPPRSDRGPPAEALKALQGAKARETKARWSVTVSHDAAQRAHPELSDAMERFERQCPELTDRTKLGNGRTRRECTNVC